MRIKLSTITKKCLSYLNYYSVKKVFRKKKLLPPKTSVIVKNGNFEEVGKEFLTYFIELGEIKPSYSILDVGCSIGRMAIPLTSYLDTNGTYIGFDITNEGIQWCSKKITPKYSNFIFQQADVFNQIYNPYGSHKPSDYIFPYDANSFDFVLLTSVFTHMLPADIENYLAQISRVIKKGKKCLITFFILNEESQLLIDKNKAVFDFKFKRENYRVQYESKPEDAVAYSESYLKEIYKNNHLKISEPIKYGSWSGREKYLSFQDIVIATKI